MRAVKEVDTFRAFNRRQVVTYLIIALILLLIAIFVIKTFITIRQEAKNACWTGLEQRTDQIAEKMLTWEQEDSLQLHTLAGALSELAGAQKWDQCATLLEKTSVSETMTGFGLLLPDQTVLLPDGKRIQADAAFSTVSTQGEFLCAVDSPSAEESNMFRHYVPILWEGHTVAVLFGEISPEKLLAQYQQSELHGGFNVLISQTDTGKMLLDTTGTGYRSAFEQLSAMQGKNGYNTQEMLEMFRAGESGNYLVATTSSREPVYLRFQPIAGGTWMVAVMAGEGTVSGFASTDPWNAYRIMFVLTGAFLLLLLWFLANSTRDFRLFCVQYKEMELLSRLDMTTGLQNRNSYQLFTEAFRPPEETTLACVFFDINGLHELNRLKGHEAGDLMLYRFGMALKKLFEGWEVFRLGGDEFIAVGKDTSESEVNCLLGWLHREMQSYGYTYSAGVEIRNESVNLIAMVKAADRKMYEDKARYYEEHSRRAI